MKRRDLIISVLIAIIMLLFYAKQFFDVNSAIYKSKFKFNIPKVDEIKTYIPSNLVVKDFSIWGLKISGNKIVKKINKHKKIIGKGVDGYILKVSKGIQSLYRISNPKYRWIFYGIIYKNQEGYGLFYNPVLKKNSVKVVSGGEYIDKNLYVSSICSDNLTVIYKTNKMYKIYNLKLFNCDLNVFRFKQKVEDKK